MRLNRPQWEMWVVQWKEHIGPTKKFGETWRRVSAPNCFLSAKLLRLCNSAAIGLRKPVASVEQAVFFLGFNEVQRLAIALGLGGSLKRKSKGIPVHL